MVVRAAALLAGAAVMTALALGLEPTTFLSGDSGVKLVATREVLAHPGRPLDITLPLIGHEATPDLSSPFYPPHGDHAHANTSALFPLLSAPFLALGGERGLYVLPALGFLLTLWLAARLSDVVQPDRTAFWTTLILAGGTPLLFYGLEFWEHTPAVALLAAATLVTVRAPLAGRAWLAAGALCGLAFLFRPEALCYGLALVVTLARPDVKTLARRAGAFLGAMAFVQLPLFAYNAVHLHALVPRHLAANAVGATEGWWAIRASIVEAWFLSGAVLPVVALVVGVAVTASRFERAGRLVVWAATLWFTVQALRGGFAPQSLWAGFPSAGLALLPLARTAEGHASVSLADLRRAALLFVALAVATAPSDGGSEWGPRYILPACVLLALLVGRVIGDACAGRTHRWAAVAATVAIVGGSLGVERTVYRHLRTLKRDQVRAIEDLKERAGASTFVVSNLWWLGDRMTAASPPLTFLYADRPDHARSALVRLAHAGASPVLLVAKSDEPPTVFDAWKAETCYRPRIMGTTRDGTLRFERVACLGLPIP